MLVMLYGLIGYFAFLGAILYAIGFVGDFLVPKTIDSGVAEPWGQAAVVDALLLALFAIQHTIMARPAFKKWWTRYVPVAIERSTFVLIASLIFGLLFWQWRPIPTVVWTVEHALARNLLVGLSLIGWALVFYSSFLIDHFDLFGLRQTFFHWRGWTYTHPAFQKPLLYRLVRNPLMLGFVIAFWSTPHMTYGHLLFAGLSTAYILVGIQFEERDLLRILGEDYRQYRRRTPMLFPFLRRSASLRRVGQIRSIDADRIRLWRIGRAAVRAEFLLRIPNSPGFASSSAPCAIATIASSSSARDSRSSVRGFPGWRRAGWSTA